eukprot:m.224094 g.224094  ORF g.224094 m.224094 type:complete len:146 (-) comp15641_c0_seq1:1912-2349(-)
MVGDSGAHSTDRSVLETLFQAGLLQGIPGDHDVTKLGFQFLLRPRREQLWCYLIEYLKQPPLDQPKTQAAALSLLFRLGFSQLGEAYPVAALSKDQQNMLVHLDKLGLVQQQEEWSSTLWLVLVFDFLSGRLNVAGTTPRDWRRS